MTDAPLSSNQPDTLLPKVYAPFPAGERPLDWPEEYVALADHNRIVERLTSQRDVALAEQNRLTELYGEQAGSAHHLMAERDRLRAAMIELHRIADSGESDIRAIGPVIDQFPELRPAHETSHCRKHGVTFDNPEMGCPRCAAENGTGCS